MKRLVCAFAVMCSTAFAQPTLNATVALVMDADTDEVLFQKNDTEVRPIASITKLMTAYVTVEANLPLDEQITITQEDVEATRLRGSPTGGSLPVGTKLMRGELLHLALMNSQNRAAAALARTYPEGREAFIVKMNATAEALGMKDTRYVDPTGLFNANRSTADDLAILVKAAAKYEVITELSTSKSFKLGPKRAFGSTNKLVNLGKWDIILQKTGFITDAGHCLVMLTSIAARKVIIVLLNEANNQLRSRDAVSLMYWVEHDQLASAHDLAVVDPQPRARRYIKRKHR